MDWVQFASAVIQSIAAVAVVALGVIGWRDASRDRRDAAIAGKQKAEIDLAVLELQRDERTAGLTAETLAARLRFAEAISPLAQQARIACGEYLDAWRVDKKPAGQHGDHMTSHLGKLRQHVIASHDRLRELIIFGEAVLNSDALKAVENYRRCVFRVAGSNVFPEEEEDKLLWRNDGPFEQMSAAVSASCHGVALDRRIVDQIAATGRALPVSDSAIVSLEAVAKVEVVADNRESEVVTVEEGG